MGVRIHVPADSVWAFAQENRSRLASELVLIAENTDTQYGVYVTIEDGHPLLAVAKGNGKIEYKEPCINEDDCGVVAKKLFVRYLFPVLVTDDKYVSQDDLDEYDEDMVAEMEADRQDAIYEREDELFLAMTDFLSAVLGEDNSDEIVEMYGAEVVQDLLDDVLKLLSSSGFSIYRPTFIRDEETGDEIYTEFPYDDELGFCDDEDSQDDETADN